MNKVLLVGHLGRDPENKTTQGGTALTLFSLATTRWYRPEGNEEGTQETEWHRVVVFGRQAEASARYLQKGSLAAVEGRMQTRSWEEEGRKRYMTEVVAERVQFLSPKGERFGSVAAPATPMAADGPANEAASADLPF